MLLVCLGVLAGGCRQAMEDQPRYKPLGASDFFEDGRAARPYIAGTVARGRLRLDEHLETGRVNGELVATFPFAVTRAVLDRGRERYNIFCSPCHDRAGDGLGMIVQRGFTRPPSFHQARLREAPAGHFFDAMTRGFGAMPNYADQVPTSDRWAIVAYIRALQLSRSAPIERVPAEARVQLEGR